MSSHENLKADFLNFVSSLSHLEQEVKDIMASKLCEKQYRKGESILEAGKVCKRIYFIDTGLVKTFFYTDTREFIMRFFPEGNMFTVLDSFVLQQPSAFSVMALEDTVVTCLNHDDLEIFCTKYHSIETFYRKLLSLATMNMMDRMGGMLEEKAYVA
ncbi:MULTISPECIES: Crp/Fnr family transcriptional regulator [Chryseobacterium]|uniref:CRP-like cAMP-binding protein n=1 Tax=Chryseobacterium camelliae TaxID=1265445 RepID=A0ABU0TI82_9FLAO|nr:MULTISPECIES: Crp/Fnr family transcriptional regulator [Chryseobacterium]MDT3409388.1 CRP-like cAMP-binding protein [Pseudacidovorax intermedius]MDQ1096747.1 CRP-like cAMP-binding protein [Chryseobacterium camelliae]MDQ1100690.1 CRP-like cAMP-binding protein [Chryseobacterium sp. SORGH_AS_1048]MDR6088028.1 CRP-like cAMP-binding protein [Chryseobacterium sp. SORGH_AS_0909]MDR6132403.1 CRP-like cAMP-binding protein [Chryseobacterium sp. SORGH_AS_1175]